MHEQVRDDICKAADCVEKEASEMLAGMSREAVNMVSRELVGKAAKTWGVTPQSIEHELAKRQASRLIVTLPRKVRNRIK